MDDASNGTAVEFSDERQSAAAPTRWIIGGNGTRFAYRRFGNTADNVPPLVLVLRLRGTIDHWDPALLDALAEHREVVIFDNRGLNESDGTPADSVPGLVDGAVEFVAALQLPEVDLLGWSLGGIVAIGVALEAPHLVRRVIVAGSSSGGVPNLPKPAERIMATAAKPVNDDEDFLLLFFPEDEQGIAAGRASLARLQPRLSESHAVLSPEAVRAQLTAIATFPGYWDRLDELAVPVLLANGTKDVMIDVDATIAVGKRVTQSKTVLYGDAGHAFLFQHATDFAAEVRRFLS